jgi:hypothetical protein
MPVDLIAGTDELAWVCASLKARRQRNSMTDEHEPTKEEVMLHTFGLST